MAPKASKAPSSSRLAAQPDSANKNRSSSKEPAGTKTAGAGSLKRQGSSKASPKKGGKPRSPGAEDHVTAGERPGSRVPSEEDALAQSKDQEDEEHAPEAPESQQEAVAEHPADVDKTPDDEAGTKTEVQSSPEEAAAQGEDQTAATGLADSEAPPAQVPVEGESETPTTESPKQARRASVLERVQQMERRASTASPNLTTDPPAKQPAAPPDGDHTQEPREAVVTEELPLMAGHVECSQEPIKRFMRLRRSQLEYYKPEDDQRNVPYEIIKASDLTGPVKTASDSWTLQVAGTEMKFRPKEPGGSEALEKWTAAFGDVVQQSTSTASQQPSSADQQGTSQSQQGGEPPGWRGEKVPPATEAASPPDTVMEGLVQFLKHASGKKNQDNPVRYMRLRRSQLEYYKAGDTQRSTPQGKVKVSDLSGPVKVFGTSWALQVSGQQMEFRPHDPGGAEALEKWSIAFGNLLNDPYPAEHSQQQHSADQHRNGISNGLAPNPDMAPDSVSPKSKPDERRGTQDFLDLNLNFPASPPASAEDPASPEKDGQSGGAPEPTADAHDDVDGERHKRRSIDPAHECPESDWPSEVLRSGLRMVIRKMTKDLRALGDPPVHQRKVRTKPTRPAAWGSVPISESVAHKIAKDRQHQKHREMQEQLNAEIAKDRQKQKLKDDRIQHIKKLEEDRIKRYKHRKVDLEAESSKTKHIERIAAMRGHRGRDGQLDKSVIPDAKPFTGRLFTLKKAPLCKRLHRGNRIPRHQIGLHQLGDPKALPISLHSGPQFYKTTVSSKPGEQGGLS